MLASEEYGKHVVQSIVRRLVGSQAHRGHYSSAVFLFVRQSVKLSCELGTSVLCPHFQVWKEAETGGRAWPRTTHIMADLKPDLWLSRPEVCVKASISQSGPYVGGPTTEHLKEAISRSQCLVQNPAHQKGQEEVKEMSSYVRRVCPELGLVALRSLKSSAW